MLEMFDLKHKVAVVIGGTSGIGEALSIGLAKAGADVVATSRNRSKVENVCKKISDLGKKSFVYPIDAASEKDIKSFYEECMNFYNKVDILINAAGINIRNNIFDLSYEDWQKVIKTNLDSVFLGIKYFAKNMVERNYGKIINIGSLNSVVAMSNLSAYAASKGGVIQLTKAAAVELSKYNINVNAILPGYFYTEMTEKIMKNEVTYNRIINRTPMKRIGKVDELVGAAIFLASDASNFITGETLAVDGGFLAFGVDLSLGN